MSDKIDELKSLMNKTADDVEAEVLARKAELETELDAIRETLGENIKGIKAFLKSNAKCIGLIAFALVVGFAFGAALV